MVAVIKVLNRLVNLLVIAITFLKIQSYVSLF